MKTFDTISYNTMDVEIIKENFALEKFSDFLFSQFFSNMTWF
jgi:hypothetical protein